MGKKSSNINRCICCIINTNIRIRAHIIKQRLTGFDSVFIKRTRYIVNDILMWILFMVLDWYKLCGWNAKLVRWTLILKENSTCIEHFVDVIVTVNFILLFIVQVSCGIVGYSVTLRQWRQISNIQYLLWRYLTVTLYCHVDSWRRSKTKNTV